MRVKIEFNFESKIILPIQYNHILQGLIYGNLSDEVSTLLHDQGFVYEKRQFKLFTFSRLTGKFLIKGDVIEYDSPVSLIVCSAVDEVIRGLLESLMRNECELCGQKLSLASVILEKNDDLGDNVRASLLSPVVAYSTIDRDNGQKYTQYYSPWDYQFQIIVKNNLLKKYELISKKPASHDWPFYLLPEGTQGNLKVLKYKNTVIKGWVGNCRLTGRPELIKTAYNAGLGNKNAMGFGCFEVVK